jgi:hypothetical protein
VDRIGHLAALVEADWAGVEEAIVAVGRDPMPDLEAGLDALAARIGRQRVRLALPIITRDWQEDGPGIQERVGRLMARGWDRWQVANLAGWPLLGLGAAKGGAGRADLAADWPLYVLNRQAALQLMDMGALTFTLSPEDGLENMRALLGEFGERAAVIAYQDTPLFLSASCARANLAGRCPGKAACPDEVTRLVRPGGEAVLAVQDRCLTAVIGERPLALAGRLADLRRAGAVRLRAEFIWRPYAAEEVRAAWRGLRGEGPPPAGHVGNLDRGLA